MEFKIQVLKFRGRSLVGVGAFAEDVCDLFEDQSQSVALFS